MLKNEEIKEIREALESSQNPLFFFDNDVDGLCSFLILRRSLDRGLGVPIKSFPDLKEQYLRKINELNPDAIFILDKAEVSEEFIKGVKEKNLPITWIDHHKTKTPKELTKQTDYYNSLPEGEPTTAIAQEIFNRKEDLWLAMIGCIGDVYKPHFAGEFEKQSPELYNSKIDAFDALHSTEIGKIVRMLDFGLMDKTTNVINLIKYLFKAKNIYDLLEENSKTRQLHKRYQELNEFYQKQIKKAEKNFNKKDSILFFSYSGNISMSSAISNRLYYNHKDKLIVVAFKKPDKINLSIRGKNALKITNDIINKIPNSMGGGHEEATGARIPLEEWENFKKNILEMKND